MPQLIEGVVIEHGSKSNPDDPVRVQKREFFDDNLLV